MKHTCSPESRCLACVQERALADATAFEQLEADLAALREQIDRVKALRDEFDSRGSDRLLVETGTSVAGMIDAALDGDS